MSAYPWFNECAPANGAPAPLREIIAIAPSADAPATAIHGSAAPPSVPQTARLAFDRCLAEIDRRAARAGDCARAFRLAATRAAIAVAADALESAFERSHDGDHAPRAGALAALRAGGRLRLA